MKRFNDGIRACRYAAAYSRLEHKTVSVVADFKRGDWYLVPEYHTAGPREQVIEIWSDGALIFDIGKKEETK